MRFARMMGVVLLFSASIAAAQTPKAPPAKAPAPSTPAAAAPTPPAPAAAPTDANRVATTEPLHLIVLPMKGSYMQHQAAFERLGGFFATHAATPQGPPVGRYFSAPSTAEADLAWEVGFPVAASVKAEAPFEIRDIPASLHAIHVHKGAYEELGSAWPVFVQWIIANGYRPSGPPLNIFQGDPGASPQVEMRMPVEK